METSLRGKYAIVGIGETEYSRGSGRTTRAMGAEAIRKAMDDAGLASVDVDGMLSYHGGDSTPSTSIMYDLGIRPTFTWTAPAAGPAPKHWWAWPWAPLRPGWPTRLLFSGQ